MNQARFDTLMARAVAIGKRARLTKDMRKAKRSIHVMAAAVREMAKSHDTIKDSPARIIKKMKKSVRITVKG